MPVEWEVWHGSLQEFRHRQMYVQYIATYLSNAVCRQPYFLMHHQIHWAIAYIRGISEVSKSDVDFVLRKAMLAHQPKPHYSTRPFEFVKCMPLRELVVIRLVVWPACCKACFLLSFIFSNCSILVRVMEDPQTILGMLGMNWDHTLNGMVACFLLYTVIQVLHTASCLPNLVYFTWDNMLVISSDVHFSFTLNLHREGWINL